MRVAIKYIYWTTVFTFVYQFTNTGKYPISNTNEPNSANVVYARADNKNALHFCPTT